MNTNGREMGERPRRWRVRFGFGARGCVGVFYRSSEAAFWSVAAGFTALYGFGCFRLWPRQSREDDKNKPFHPVWFIHMYWQNGLGCFIGWGAARLLYKVYAERTELGAAGAALLCLAAFLGMVGLLPLTISGIAVGVRNLAAKIMDNLIPSK